MRCHHHVLVSTASLIIQNFYSYTLRLQLGMREEEIVRHFDISMISFEQLHLHAAEHGGRNDKCFHKRQATQVCQYSVENKQ